jgi:hypothetical protein
MMQWRFAIPFATPSLNQYLSMHWTKRSALKKQIAMAVLVQGGRTREPAIEYALLNAGKGKPDFVPSAEAVREIAEMEAKRLDVLRRQAARGKQLQAPKSKEYELDPKNPFAQLAAMWEQALGHYTKHPEARPVDLHDRWRQQFHETWERAFGEKWGKPA